MDARERFVCALRFQEVDRYPFMPGGPRESTLARWRTEGLPEGRHYMDTLREAVGIQSDSKAPHASHGVDFRMRPQYEERVLEHRDSHYVVQDWMGNVVEISDRYDYTYIREARDFVTRRWLRFPVSSGSDWEQMRRRYDPHDSGRFPGDFAERCRVLAQRDYPAGIHVNGPFWQLREWLGFEPLCERILTDPDFVAEMVAFWTGFVDTLLGLTLERCPADYLLISEDMAYKEHPMISPGQARDLLLPSYAQWVTTARRCGCDLVVMDSDGYIADLIPIWVDAGIRACNPIEVAAGNDIVALRKRYGREMAYWGGIDKRAIAAGGTEVEREVGRVCSLFGMGGGLAPSCDHGVPPDISWQNFVRYGGLLARACGWR